MNRDSSGKFSFEGGWHRLCICGHMLGVHAGEPPHPCFNEDIGIEGATGHPCNCKKFVSNGK